MRECLKFYIDGEWVAPQGSEILPVINPATEGVMGRVAIGSAADVDIAVAAAKHAFKTWSVSTREERLALLRRLAEEYERRADELGRALTEEMGAPTHAVNDMHLYLGRAHIKATIETLQDFVFQERRDRTVIRREPIGVCALITPWNWPMNQIVCKVTPALAAGCTMVLKPSEIAPFSAQIFTEMLEAAGVPPGVFNLVNGDGPGVGVALSKHPDVDMVSFTGSTRAGVEVAKNAAPTVKRVAQELGGKSPLIILDDEKFAEGVAHCVNEVMYNSGQSCDASTRMLVPRHRMEEAIRIAKDTAEGLTIGDPTTDVYLGPVVSQAQFDKIQGLIEVGIKEGATLVSGGLGRPDGLNKGYFVKPTVFANVTNDMAHAREEIHGPVLSILAYEDLDHAVEISNDSDYGLHAFVWGKDVETLYALANQLRTGRVGVNGGGDIKAPFGGYKQSGNGREWGEFGLADFLEIKAIIDPKTA